MRIHLLHAIGLRNWLLQRLTGIIIALYLISIGVLWIYQDGYQSWHTLFQNLVLRCATTLFFVSLLVHAWLGVKEILKDYIQSPKLRDLLRAIVILTLITEWIWSFVVVWR